MVSGGRSLGRVEDPGRVQRQVDTGSPLSREVWGTARLTELYKEADWKTGAGRAGQRPSDHRKGATL